MEVSQSDAGANGPHVVDQKLHMSSKPLHRFIKGEPKSLGIAILLLGCAELLMGFVGDPDTSVEVYIPFWQGVLFLACGILSIYTEMQPSKKAVTVCLAMYIVTLLGIIISFSMRLAIISRQRFHRYYYYYDGSSRAEMQIACESVLTALALCVFGFLIFLSTVARLALRSPGTQFIIQHVQPAQDVTSN